MKLWTMTFSATGRQLYFLSCQKCIPILFQRRYGIRAATINNQFSSSDIHQWASAKPFDSIPGLRSIPLFGTMWGLFPLIGYGIPISKLLDYQQLMFKKFGPIWRDILPGNEVMVAVVKPEDAEKVFRSEGKFPERAPLQALKAYREDRVQMYTSGGVLNSNGVDWWNSRSKVQEPFLKTKNIASYAPVIGEIAQEFIKRISVIRQENNEVKPDFLNELYRWALESVGVVAFDTRLGCLDAKLSPDSEAQKMIDAANFSFTVISELEFTAHFWKYYKPKKVKQLYEAQDFFTKTAIKYIQKTMERIKQRSPDNEEDPSILESMLRRGMSPQDAVATVVDLLMAGIDTTSNTIGFLLFYLARNPDKQETLRKEVLSIVGPKGSPISSSSLNKLVYLKACVKEILRLRSAAIGNVRTVDRDMVLSGYQVPKGTMVIMLHHIPAHLNEYFPKANEFIPERWIKGHPLESHHHPYTLLPFGFGTRMCLGRRLAELEMKMLIAKVVQNYEIQYHHDDIGPMYRLISGPDKPLKFRFVDID